jgi:uncharacterized membrane protein
LEAYLLDWLSLLVRWLHFVAGVAWIGASFYFVWLDNHLDAPPEDGRGDPGIAGELHAVHGGGFYRAQKYRIAPPLLPPVLYWFKWEAYTTWISGMALLVLLYFLRAEAYLIDPAVHAWSKPAAVAVALGVLVASWSVYDLLCRSPLAKRPDTLAAILALLVTLLAYGLCQIYGGRGAFIMFGAALGTIMVANVFFVIIPGQRELVRAKEEGRDPDPAPGLRGKQRSIHNTYFTLPVLFVMIGNHYAMTYGARYNWLVLIALSFAGASLRGWFVARHRSRERGGDTPLLPAALGIVVLATVVVALAPLPGPASAMTRDRSLATTAGAALPTRDAARVQRIVATRCVPCHSEHPTQAGFGAPPNGVLLQTLDQLQAHRLQVETQLMTRAMPVGNLTAMTEEERATLIAWAQDSSRP